MKQPIPFASACMVLLALAVAGCQKEADAEGHKAETTQPAAKEPAKPVDVKLTRDAIEENHVEATPVGKRVLVPTFAAPARVAFNAEAMARLGAPVAGRVAELKVRLGDEVKAGEELLSVESPDLGEAQSDYLQKQTAAAASKAAAEPLKISAERGRALYEQSQGLSLAEVQKREADLRAGEASAQAAAAAVGAARNKLMLMGMPEAAIGELEKGGKLTPRYAVRTPIEGTVIQFDLTPGALVGPDKDLQVVVADVGKVWVLADVPEASYVQLRKGAAAKVTVAALPGKTFDGKVALVAPSLDPATRTVQARIDVQNSEGALRPGMLAQAEIESPGGGEPVLAVPSDAVFQVEDEAFVFVPAAGETGKFKRVDVKAGDAVGGWTPIVSGLKEGDKVVTRGAVILKAQLSKPAETD